MELGLPRQHRLLIPRVIWVAWHQGLEQAPAIVRSCIGSWKSCNPSWQVRVVSHDDWSHYLSPDSLQRYETLPQLKPAHQADWLRLQLLIQHGGIWADATTLCRQPLDQWLPGYTKQGFFAFSKPGPDRLISNWFIASSPHHPLTTEWSKRYEGLLLKTRAKRMKRLQKPIRQFLKKRLRDSPHAARIWCHPLTGSITAHLHYFSHHYCFAESLRSHNELKHIWESVPTISAMPCHWLQEQAMEGDSDSNSTNSYPAPSTAPVFKLNRRINTPEQRLIHRELLRIHAGF